jgi:ribosomal protein S12 methylthiotransferase accessory factor
VRVLKPVRADRRYLDSYRSDFKDVTDLWCQLQVQLDPRAYARERPWDAGRTVHPADLPPSVPRGLDAYVERISSRGHDVIYVDVTTPDVAKVGFAAVRVLIPGLLPNFPAAFPPLGGGRLRATAERLGWIEPGGPLAVNTFPLPYS